MAIVDSAPAPAPDASDRPKPRLRGMFHLAAFPVSIVAGTVLLAFVGEGTATKAACAAYVLSSEVLFGVSALYHRGTWSRRHHALLRRLDHSNIFLLIAGTYTPISLALLDGATERAVLVVVWAGAVAGIVFRVVWLSAPSWLYTPLYVALGWVAIAVMPTLWGENAAVATLLVIGGTAYSLGGLVYALRRPDPAPLVFGYHEIFHLGTLVGFAAHYAAVVLAVR